MSTFSTHAWLKLDSAEKEAHALRGCCACSTLHESASQAFPISSESRKKAKSSAVSLSFNVDELSTPQTFGSALLAKGNEVCQAKFQKSVQNVLTQTPRSGMISKPNHRTRLFQRRNVLREIKNTVERDMHGDSDMVVLQNRISWDKFDRVRKTQGLSSTQNSETTTTPSRKRKHGCNSQNINIDKDQLLNEANSWAPDQPVQWSELARKYGLTTPNCGQVIKEYLAEQGVSAACISQRTKRAQRRPKKRLPGGKISFPMYPPVKKLKQRVQDKITWTGKADHKKHFLLTTQSCDNQYINPDTCRVKGRV